jgi:HK97 family phage portal protein
LKKQWDAAHAGSDKAHGTIVLEEGMKWSQVGMSNEDSQFLESRGFEIEEIARIWRVPCILIGHPNNTMTYASAEQFFLSFITHTIRPHLVRIEQALNLVLFDEAERKKLFCEFKLDGLLRGSTSERYAAYASALQNEWMCADEVRGLENLNPKPDGTGSIFKNPAINPMKSATPPDGGTNGA